MKILLLQNMLFAPPLGGANKATRRLVEEFAARGHTCHVVCPALASYGFRNRTEVVSGLTAQGATISELSDAAITFAFHGVNVQAFFDIAHARDAVQTHIRKFSPDWILVAAEDPGQLMLQAALEISPGNVIYLAQTPWSLPFGKWSMSGSRSHADLVRSTRAVVTISSFMKRLIESENSIAAHVLPFPVYRAVSHPTASFEKGAVVIVNPSAIKGISIFLDLARAFPEVQFAAVPTWSTTQQDLDALQARPNIQLWAPDEDIDALLNKTRVLLVPSLWPEAFGYVCVDAMLHGIPVLASEVGGLREAKLGVDYILPVSPIVQFSDRVDEHKYPVPIVPPQDTDAWRRTLGEVLHERSVYEAVSRDSRAAAVRYVSTISIERWEEFLDGLSRGSETFPASFSSGGGSNRALNLDNLTDQERSDLSLKALQRKRERKNRSAGAIARLPRSGGEDVFPASSVQRQMWLAYQVSDSKAAYHIALEVNIRGPLACDVLEECLAQMLRRHEILRTMFQLRDGVLMQVIVPSARPMLRYVDSASCAKTSLAAAETDRPFDLAAGPLIRFVLTEVAANEHRLMVTLHHIVSDGWSLKILLRDLLSLYQGSVSGSLPKLPELLVQYADYTAWQRQRLTPEKVEQHLGYWRAKLAAPRTALQLNLGPSLGPASSASKVETIVLPESISAQLRAFSAKECVSVFVLLLAAFKCLLHRYTAETDIVIGSPISTRDTPQVQDVVGPFLNVLPLRDAVLPTMTFLEVLHGVEKTMSEAHAHRELPVDSIAEALGPNRGRSVDPWFHVLFVGQYAGSENFTMDSLTVNTAEIPRDAADFELALVVVDEPQKTFRLAFEYHTCRFSPASIRRLACHFQTLLAEIIVAPDQRISSLPLLTPIEREELVSRANGVIRDYGDDDLLHRLIEAQVQKTPDQEALVFEGQSLNYRELNARADAWAGYLQELGVGPDTLVAICAERSLEMVVGLLAVLKAGGAYVPLDPRSPAEWLSRIVKDSGVKLILGQSQFSSLAEGSHHRWINLEVMSETPLARQKNRVPSPVRPDNAAYMIYTSGSTGIPKGVINTHRGICNRLHWMQERFELQAGDRVLQKTPYTFDVSVWEFFWPLLNGATLVIARPGGHRETDYLADVIRDERITTAHFVPSMLAYFLDEPRAGISGGALRRVMCSGETLPPAVMAKFYEKFPGCELHNLYGPTEAAVDVSHWACDQAMPVTIGKPIANLQLHIMDAAMELVPSGCKGELYIGGVGLARGYWGRPELTAQSFVPNPWSERGGERLYRTGDVCRYRDDGNIEFLGRDDGQIKVRGFRVELAEIESQLQEYEQVRLAAVKVDGSGPDARLVAFVELKGTTNESVADVGAKLRTFLSRRLPEYMVVSDYIVMPALPLNSSGKIDRKALNADGVIRQRMTLEYVEPETSLERELAQLWQEVLGIDRVGLKDNFFERGGHSLLMTQLASRLRHEYGVEVPLRALFDGPTIPEMGVAIASAQMSAQDPQELEKLLQELGSDDPVAPPLAERDAVGELS